jgi:hypothetical protein
LDSALLKVFHGSISSLHNKVVSGSFKCSL